MLTRDNGATIISANIRNCATGSFPVSILSQHTNFHSSRAFLTPLEHVHGMSLITSLMLDHCDLLRRQKY
jgi:hypothetical protein